MVDNSTKNALLTATNSAPQPGDFPVGSALSRAAARMLLKQKERAAEYEANRAATRPPDLRFVVDLGRHKKQDRTTSVRDVDGDEIKEIVFPGAHEGECVGCCSLRTDVSVEQALRVAREIQFQQKIGRSF